jgi:hypothetical protein
MQLPDAAARPTETALRKVPERRAARLEPFKAVIDGWLRADLDAPRKQRHRAPRIHALSDEHEATDVSYAALRDYVARHRPGDTHLGGRRPRSGRRSAALAMHMTAQIAPFGRIVGDQAADRVGVENGGYLRGMRTDVVTLRDRDWPAPAASSPVGSRFRARGNHGER